MSDCIHTSIKLSATQISYQVGSANFPQRKIGHAHDNSVDSENVAGAPQRSVHAHFIFRFENGPGNQSFFSIHDQNTAETSQAQAQPKNDWRAMNRACPRGLKRPLEKFDSARLSRKKWPAVNAVEKIDERSMEADVSAFSRSIGLFFCCSFFYDHLRTLDLRFLLWMYLASILLERFWSARRKAITFFAAHLAESSPREGLACGPVIELLHRRCNWLE